MSNSSENCEKPPVDRLKYCFPPELPISAAVAEIKHLWRQHQVVIIGGATGSGKTTQLPKIALEIGRGRSGRIGCTQPRRLAASAMARRVAQELAVECGNEVGYQVRFDNRTTRDTVIKFMTDGILLAETAADRQLKQYDTLIIDEAHERSLNIDFILGYLKNLLPRRPDLKIAISSATLDVGQFSEFFGGAPVIEVEGRMYPVEDVFLPPEEADEDLEDQVARGVEFLSDLDRRGDILVFLPGEREIRDCTEKLAGRKLPETEILPLFARLSSAEQQRIFKPGRLRRIILATNVAETSITIPRIRYCIDSGLARISRYNPRTRIQELQIETISQASARQRRGRCGRLAEGICVHLYSEDDLRRSSEYTDPEIKRTSLAGVILQMAALKLPKIRDFPFIDPPSGGLIREGMHTLEDIRAILPGGKLTPDGWKLAAIPLDPHLGKMLLAARDFKVLPELLIITASLSIADPRERPLDKQQQADEQHRKFRDEKSDFTGILRLWALIASQVGDQPSHGQIRRCCRQHFLNYNRVMEWRNLVDDLRQVCRELHWKVPGVTVDLETLPHDQVHQAILAGIPRHIAKYVPEFRYYLGTGGRKFDLFPGSGLFKRKAPAAWIVTFALVETSRIFGRVNAEIRPDYLERVAPHLCVSVFEQPEWDEKSGFVYAREKLTFGGLVIHSGRRVHYGKSHPKEAREIFIRAALVPGRVDIPGTWVHRHRLMLRELESLEFKVRRPGSIVDYEAIYEHFDTLLPAEVISTDSLKKLLKYDSTDYSLNRADARQRQYIEFDEDDYPDTLNFSGHDFLLEYRFEPGSEEDGISLLSPEDETNLLPPWALDYLVPGYLPEKVELLLRSLPKPVRQQLFPLAEQAAAFCRGIKAGEIFTEQPLEHALIDYLAEHHDIRLSSGCFAAARLPEYLQLKLAEMNSRGEIRQISRELPEQCRTGSRLSAAVNGVKSYVRSNCRSWPYEGNLPPELLLPESGKPAYPALVDEGESVGTQLFLHRSEAANSHRAALVRLFRLQHADQVKFIRRTFQLPKEILLSWFVNDRDREHLEELLALAIMDSFGVDSWEIRDAESCSLAFERARQQLGETADELLEKLRKLYTLYQPVRELVEKQKSRPGVDSRDLRAQLKFLFGPGFLSRPAVWSDYPRYLRALKIRTERFGNNPVKDVEKFQLLAEYVERFELALQSVGDLLAAPDLYEFWVLLEECRIAVFAPEVALRIRNPLNKLDSSWKEMRL